VGDGVAHDVSRVHIGEFVDDLPASPTGSDQPGSTQHAQMLAHERLRRPDSVDQLVDAILMVCEEVDHGETDRGREGSKEAACSLVTPDVEMRNGQKWFCVELVSHRIAPMHVCALDNRSVARFPVHMSRTGDDQTVERNPDRRLLIGLAVILVVCLGIYLFFWSGLFRFQPEDGETFWHLMHQKGHWYLEVFISGVETLLFDIIIGLVGWRYLLKPYMAQRQAQAIAADHALHGIDDHDAEARL
jgi:hypothetical protein